MGQRIEDFTPLIFSMVPKRIANRRTMASMLGNQAWIQDIHGVTTVEVIMEFLQLWDLIIKLDLQPGVTSGISPAQDVIQLGQLMKHCFRDLLPSVLGNGYGKLGLPTRADFSFG
ncbi:hypothetical protein PR202_gb16071 [Eleusine coracana subsp. coracana]|uniref:Uncharacterized protein n=1 Tax=Eleusine coracana subsp. coracana TaxID=191504 RepID=A0AAV5EZJ3_ELECO|nr:hypothetical protein PR202_gb16071 [Eleusine coracana subsp. coracana]